MRLSSGIAVGVGCVSVVQVSSFSALPLATSSVRTSSAGRDSQAISHREARVRPRGLTLPLAAAEDEAGEGEAGGDEVDDMSSQVMTKKKKGGGELDDIMSEVADRGEISEADKAAQLAAFREAKIASFNPLPPGRIIPDPIPGMDASDVPGKIEVGPDTLFQQQRDLEQIARVWRRERLDREEDDMKFYGWTVNAEKWNGRSAMVGIVAGLLTESFTGHSIPQQIEDYAQILGLLPLDYETYFQ